MAKPLSRILVIEDEPLVLREIVKGLNAAARSLDNPLGITFNGGSAGNSITTVNTGAGFSGTMPIFFNPGSSTLNCSGS